MFVNIFNDMLMTMRFQQAIRNIEVIFIINPIEK